MTTVAALFNVEWGDYTSDLLDGLITVSYTHLTLPTTPYV